MNRFDSKWMGPVLLIVFLVLVFLSPILLSSFDNQFSWPNTLRVWRNNLFLIPMLFIHHFVLLPLLFCKRRTAYVGGTLLLLFVATLASFLLFSHQPPPPLNSDLPIQPQGKPLPPFVSLLILAVLGMSIDLATALFKNWNRAERQRLVIQKESAENQLAFLRHQVSPHFFMNTLNNIHSLVDMDTAGAKDAIIRLSTLMRYLLYDSANGKVELKKETDFIKSYFSLMQLRLWDDVEIRLDIPNDLPNIQVPPMLFISPIENAFKHGIGPAGKSFIHFSLHENNGWLQCNVKNSKHPRTSTLPEEYSGIGLSNLKKSLELLYPNRHQLNIFDRENEFELNIKIPV